MLKKVLLFTLKTVLPLALGLYLFYFFFSSMSNEMWIVFKKALLEANYIYIILAVLLGILAYFLRAMRWHLVLSPLGYNIPLSHRYHAVMIGYLVNLTIPRAGEASRSAMLYRSDAVPFSTSFGTIIAERAIDFVLLCSIGLFTAFITYDDFWFIKHQIELKFQGNTNEVSIVKYIILGGILLGFILFTFLYIKKEAFRLKLKNFAKELLGGLIAVFKMKQAGLYILYTLGIWCCYLVMFALPFYALQETSDISFSGIMLAFCAGAIGITFTNGGVGTYPLLVGMVVALYIQKDYPLNAQGIGNALGMIIWASQTIFMILLGLISLYLLPKNYTKHGKISSDSAQNQ